MSGTERSDATRLEFDEVMRSTRFATIEQLAADLGDLPPAEPTGRPGRPPADVRSVATTQLPSRLATHAR